jgi:hypothetical protein
MQTLVATFSHVSSYGKLCREMSAAGPTPMLLLAWLTEWLQLRCTLPVFQNLLSPTSTPTE